jgi:carboxymethylenebutenolidase
MYTGAQHAFHNDTSAARYNKEAATLAWSRTLAFFKKHLSLFPVMVQGKKF